MDGSIALFRYHYKIAEETGTDIIDDYLDRNNASKSGTYEVEVTYDVLFKLYGKRISTFLRSGSVDEVMSRGRNLHEYYIRLKNILKKQKRRGFH